MNIKTNFKKKLLSLILTITMIGTLMVMPVSVSAFTGQNYFAPGGHAVTVNGITATVTNYNEGTRQMTVHLSGTPTVATFGTSASITAGAGLYAYLIYARANGGGPEAQTSGTREGVTPSSGLITNIHSFFTAATPAALNTDITLTLPVGTIESGSIVLYIGMRSRRLNTTAGGSTNHIGVTQTTNAFKINDITINVTHSGNSQYSGVAAYTHSGIAKSGGSITTWFEADSTTTGGTNADVGSSNAGDSKRSPRSQVTQDIRTAHYYAGDIASGAGSWTLDVGNPGGMILRAEFSGLPSFGGELSANGLTGGATGILHTSGTHVYAVDIALNGTTLQSGNHSVRLDLSSLPNDYRADCRIEGEPATATTATRIFHLDGSTATTRSVKFNITHTSGNIGADGVKILTNTTTGLKVYFDFEEDAEFNKSANGVSLTGSAKASYDAGIVTATLNMATQPGNPTTLGGNYRIDLKNKGSDIAGVDQRVLYFPAGASVNRDIRYAFDFNNNLWGDLDLTSVFDFVADTPITATAVDHGISASGSASLAYDSQLANINVDIAGMASLGSYKVTLYRGSTAVDTRTYRFGTADENTYVTRNFKSQIDLSQLYSGSQLQTNLETLKLDYLALSLTVDFIAAGPIGSDVPLNGVILSGTRAIDTDIGSSSLTLTAQGNAVLSGNHYVNVICTPSTVSNTIEEKYYYLRAGQAINRVLNFTVDSTDAALTLAHEFYPDSTIYTSVGSVDATGTVSKNFDTKSVSVDVKLSGSASEGTSSGNYKVYLDGYPDEYRMFYLKGTVNESAKYSLDLNNLDTAEFKEFTPNIVIEFYPDIFADNNGVTATGRVAVYEDECAVNVSLSGYALETGYYTVSLRNADNTLIDIAEPKMYFEDGKVVDSVVFNVPLDEITDITAMKLNLAFTSNTSFIYEIDYYNELVIFGGEVNYGKDILYTLVKAPVKFETPGAPEKAKWFPTLNGRVDISKQIPKKGVTPFYIALKYIGINQDFIEKYNVGADGVIKGFAYKPGDDPSEPISESKTTPFSGNYIELKPRPANTALKTMAKTFYDVDKQEFTNTNADNATIEVLFGLDKGKKLEKKLENRYGNVFTEELAKGQSYPFDADKLPAGTPGIIRVAPVNFVSQEVNDDGQLEYLSEEELAANYKAATFASLPIKFKIGAQPKAPKADPTKVGITTKNPNLVSGLTEKMGIVLETKSERIDADGYEGKGINYKVVRTWNATSLKKNMTVAEFDAMLIASGVEPIGVVDSDSNPVLGGNGEQLVVADKSKFTNIAEDTYEFELRLLPQAGKKLMSAKTVLQINKAAYDKVCPYVIEIPQAPEPEEEDIG